MSKIFENEKLTIVILSYNRRNLLEKAIQSCFNQTRCDFDLVIVDNGSTDGAREYIEELQHAEIRIKKILNKENFGAPSSELLGVENSDTLWITYLCDDDQYKNNFVESFYSVEKDKVSCIVFSAELVDISGNVIAYSINQNTRLLPGEAIVNILENKLHCAGISNFVFQKTAFNSGRVIPFYPCGFYRDTLLVTRAVADRGVITSSKITYKRLIHPGSASTYSDQKIFAFYKAMLLFNKDLENEIFCNEDLELSVAYLKMPFRQFFESVVFQIATLGKLNLISAWGYVAFSMRVNKRFLFNAVMLFLMSPLLASSTLPLRRKLNSWRKRLNG